jgi:hypothetical protein
MPIVLGQKEPALFEAGDVTLLHLLFEGFQSFLCDALFFSGRSVVFEEGIEAALLVGLPPASELSLAVAEHVGEGAMATVVPAL